MQANINNIKLGTANTFEHLSSGFKMRVVGDGKVESEIADQFNGAGFLEDINDRRLRQFLRGHQQLRQDKKLYEDNISLTNKSLAETLGKGWSIDALYGTNGQQKGSVGIARIQLKYDEVGAGSQSINLQYYDNAEISLTTTCPRGRWQIRHCVEGKLPDGALDSHSLVETASFSNPAL